MAPIPAKKKLDLCHARGQTSLYGCTHLHCFTFACSLETLDEVFLAWSVRRCRMACCVWSTTTMLWSRLRFFGSSPMYALVFCYCFARA
jgi:hypothetical protein